MSRIEFEQISEDEIEVFFPSETPMEMVEQIKKSFVARGLVEDLAKSTVSTRYYFRPGDDVNKIADKLIKSLEDMAKDDFDYSAKAKKLWRRSQGVKDAVAAQRPPAAPIAPAAPAAPGAAAPRQIFDNSNTAGGTGKRYAYISDKVAKEEHKDNDPKCACEKCSMDKSDYGPKGAKLYNDADNARRKANNLDPVGAGPNKNAKAISTKPGQMSGKAQVDMTARIQAAANKKQPVKQWSADEIEAENKKRGLKKAWGQHLPFPSAEEEIMKLAKANPAQVGEDALANQLANVMQGKNMLGSPPPAQPTNEQLFGHLVVTEEMAKANEAKWQGAAFDWLKEAAKPITQKFASEEDEIAYWNSIKVSDRDDGKSGY